MTEPEGIAATVGPGAAPESRGERSPQRSERQEETPLLVEVAWLVIETATAISRLRRILIRL